MKSLLQIKPTPLTRYGLAVGLSCLALLLTRFVPPLSTQGTFVLSLAAIISVAWYGGRMPGIVTTVLSVLAIDYFLILPTNSFFAHPLRNAAGLLVFVAVAVLFIEFAAAHKRDERTLQETAGLLDLTHDTVFARNMNDVITYWNHGAEEMYGWTREDAIGWVSHDLMKTAFPMPLQKINEELLRTGRWEGELVHTKRDGTQVVVSSRWALQRGQSGAPIAILETNNDISERKRAEEERERLRQLESDLAHMNRLSMMGGLAASLAHEITQPIATARNNARAAIHFLDRSPPDLDEVREALACVVGDADRAGDIIDRIRAHIRKLPPQKDRFDLHEAINEVIGLAQRTITENGVSVETRLATGLLFVQGDRVQLQQVVMNLILNAVEAMSSVDEGARELLIGVERGRADGALVTVRDSGPGIDADHLERVFDAFYTTKSDGVGMGLSICRSIIESHGGRLWADANVPRGAAFQFTCPTHKESS